MPRHDGGDGSEVVGPVSGAAVGPEQGELQDERTADGEHTEQGSALPPKP